MLIRKLLGTKCSVLYSWTPRCQQTAAMAQYPKYYIEPIYKKEAQEDLIKSGEVQKYTHIPTKAALNDQTCSLSVDPLVSLFINYVMRDGEKSLARGLVETTFENIKRMQIERYHKCKSEEDKLEIELDPKAIFFKAVQNCKPILQLSPIKRGGVTYQVPMPITDGRAQFISMKWLINAGQEKDRKVRFATQLARELIDAANNTGRVVRKKQELHRQCEGNKAFAHYRWS